MNNSTDILITCLSSDGLVISKRVLHDEHRELPQKNTLDYLDKVLRSRPVRKIVIHKISDYKEGDIF